MYIVLKEGVESTFTTEIQGRFCYRKFIWVYIWVFPQAIGLNSYFPFFDKIIIKNNNNVIQKKKKTNSWYSSASRIFVKSLKILSTIWLYLASSSWRYYSFFRLDLPLKVSSVHIIFPYPSISLGTLTPSIFFINFASLNPHKKATKAPCYLFYYWNFL